MGEIKCLIGNIIDLKCLKKERIILQSALIIMRKMENVFKWYDHG